jgi:16S rRNA pseudouridine516 synthase
MRLDKYLVQATDLSRSQAQHAVRSGRVTVAGQLVRDPSLHLDLAPGHGVVRLDGDLVAVRGPRYFILHKPAGYVCAARDARHPTVLELLPLAERDGLHIAGRLDRDTTGLVLLTDDGNWSHRVTSPRHRCAKCYRVGLADPLHPTDVGRLEAGLQLHGDKHPTRPARVERLGERELLLTLDEGRYHQVKRMFGALGNRVLSLHRERVGSLVLDPVALPEGQYRALTTAEVLALG